MLPVDEQDGKDSGGKLAMEEEEVVLETKFPAKECVVEPEDVKWLCKATKIWGKESAKAREKARVRSCCERVKVRAVVTGAAGAEEYPKKTEPKKKVGQNPIWRPKCYLKNARNMKHLQHPMEEKVRRKTWGKHQKQPRDSLQGVPMLRRNANARKRWLKRHPNVTMLCGTRAPGILAHVHI